MKFKKGDRCRITGNSNNHKFKIGEEVEIEGESSQFGRGYKAWHLDRSDYWWVRPEDMELITEYSPDLTMMQKFEAGWIFTHKDGTTVTDMGVLKSGKIAVEWSDGDSSVISEAELLNSHTITPPVEKKFSLIDYEDFGVLCDHDRTTLSEAKELVNSYSTCILEHHKVDGKWVFVKAHGV